MIVPELVGVVVVAAFAIAALPRRDDPVVMRIPSLNRLNDQSKPENR